jgi:metallophosphoesterase superfamily enzyme
MSIEIIPDTGAIVVDDRRRFMVLADLHFTDESDIVYDIVDKVKKLLKQYNCTELVVLGDIYHFRTGGEHVDYFDNELSEVTNIHYVQGNHDLPVFLSYIGTDRYFLTHGHLTINDEKNRILVVAHTHPYYKDKRVFIIGELKDGTNFYLLPVFNPEQLGPDVRQKNLLIGLIFDEDMINAKKTFIHGLDGKKIAKWTKL